MRKRPKKKKKRNEEYLYMLLWNDLQDILKKWRYMCAVCCCLPKIGSSINTFWLIFLRNGRISHKIQKMITNSGGRGVCEEYIRETRDKS